jgi:uncharacterized protein YegL
LYDKIKDEHNPKENFEFEEKAKVFLGSYGAMQNKYQQLLLKQSQVRRATEYRKQSFSSFIFYISATCTNVRAHDA